jgi:hypothetical protein
MISAKPWHRFPGTLLLWPANKSEFAVLYKVRNYIWFWAKSRNIICRSEAWTRKKHTFLSLWTPLFEVNYKVRLNTVFMVYMEFSVWSQLKVGRQSLICTNVCDSSRLFVISSCLSFLPPLPLREWSPIHRLPTNNFAKIHLKNSFR